VALLGALIMPHNLFLHSSLVHSRHINSRRKDKVSRPLNSSTICSLPCSSGGVCETCLSTCDAAAFPPLCCSAAAHLHQVQEAVRFFAIESALALLTTFVINIFVIGVFAAGFYGKVTQDEIGLGNAGAYLEERFGFMVQRPGSCPFPSAYR